MLETRFDEAILRADPARRQRILPILDAALNAVDPAAAVMRYLRCDQQLLMVGSSTFDLARIRHIYVIGFGKAAAPMAQAAAQVLGERLTEGVIVTKYGHGPDDATSLGRIALCEAGHPIPDEAGLAAARRVVALAEQAGPDDLVLCLISGGGSALLTLPADGIGLADLQQATGALLRCGATINEINTLRKHLSQVKGGQLARLAYPATLISLVVSDVVGSPLDVIASGPTVADGSTWSDAWAIVEKYDLAQDLPECIINRLRAGMAGAIADTPKAHDQVFEHAETLIIADNAIAAEAALRKARAVGFNAIITSTFVEGEAREVAKVLVGLGREIATFCRPVTEPACLILGGETTVTLRGDGKGGRNQELALAAALVLDQVPDSDRIVLASLATDGTDGPTDSAGGLVDASTVERGRQLGLDAAEHLKRNDSYPYLQAVGDMLTTGPTQTNVNDLMFVFVL